MPASVSPFRVRQGRAVEFVASPTPAGRECVHQLAEAVVVPAGYEVSQLRRQHIFHAGGDFLANSRFRQIRRASALQLPQRVFIFLMQTSATRSPTFGDVFDSKSRKIWHFIYPDSHISTNTISTNTISGITQDVMGCERSKCGDAGVQRK